MKLLFVIESLQTGGAEKSLVTLLKNLDKEVYNIDLLVFNQGGILEIEVPSHVNIYYQKINLSFLERIQYKIEKKFYKPKHQAQLFRKFALQNASNLIKEYDVAIAYNQGFATYYVAKKVEANKKIAWVNVDYQKAGYEIEKDLKYYKDYDKVVCVSQPAYESFTEALEQINSTEIETIIIKDISDVKEIHLKSNAFRPSFNPSKVNIVTVGRLAKPKGYDLAVKSAQILSEKGIKFHWHFIGEGPERLGIEKMIQAFKLESHITLYGDQANPYPFMKHADIYVQTSLFEGLGLTLIEASLLKKPIVCTNFPTTYNLLENGISGLICEMNPKAIANSILELINNIDLKERIVSNLDSKSEEDMNETLNKINLLFQS